MASSWSATLGAASARAVLLLLLLAEATTRGIMLAGTGWMRRRRRAVACIRDRWQETMIEVLGCRTTSRETTVSRTTTTYADASAAALRA